MIETLKNNEVISTFFAITMLALSATIFGNFLKKIKLPAVIGEIIGGIVLGPSLLGYFFPQLYNKLFFSFGEEGKVLNIFYWFGLILLMLVSGYDIRLSFDKYSKKLVIGLLISSCFLPFVIGFFISPTFAPMFIHENSGILNFSLLFSIAIAVTSIPVISKIFLDLGILNSNFAGAIISASTIEDLLEWVILSIMLGISSNNKNIWEIIFISTITIVMLFSSLVLLPKMISKFQKYIHHPIKIVFLICLIYITICSILFGINIIYSALVVGIVLKRYSSNFFKKSMKKIKSISVDFFIPLYFALVGLRINLIEDLNVLNFLFFFFISGIITIVSVVVVLKLMKIRKDVILSFAIATSAKGGPGIVLATIGFEFHIINAEFYTALILTSIISSLIAGLFLRLKVEKQKFDFDNI